MTTRSAIIDMSTAGDEERGIAITLHVATLAAQVLTAGLLHVFVPAIALALTAGKGAWLREHVKEQLNFQLTYVLVSAVAAAVGFLTFGLGWLLMLPLIGLLFAVDVVCSVLAALAASRNEAYRFPFSIRFIR